MSLRPQTRPGPWTPPPESEILRQSGLSGDTAFIAMGLDGEMISARNQDLPLPPASVAKSVTALYAMEALGGAYRFATVVMGTGPIEGGVLKGDLILRGTGDPVFDTDALGALASEVVARGIKRITGRFLVNGTGLPPIEQIDPGQLPQAGYNPSISGLNLNYNRVHFEWRKTGDAYRLTMDARAQRYQPRVASSAMRIVPEAWPVYTHRKKNAREEWTVARPALGNGGARWLPVRAPEFYAGDVFRSISGGMGLALPQAEHDTRGDMRGQVIASHVSPTLRGLCGGMLRYSTNLTAEVLGLRATQALGGAPASLAASAAMMNAWAKGRFDADMALVDHSGLGDASRITCASLAKVMGGAEGLPGMLKDIAVKDPDGRVIAAPGHRIRAKTGTLNFVSSLAGYVYPEDGTPFVFAIISSDLEKREAIAEQDRDRPAGSRTFARRARVLQQLLIARWAQASVET
ncbi:MAG: D-alanyl-D-alanine carboxypeptidase/D-alanyl-D-alanine-endopeptidase [Pseudomonadota bacterium]